MEPAYPVLRLVRLRSLGRVWWLNLIGAAVAVAALPIPSITPPPPPTAGRASSALSMEERVAALFRPITAEQMTLAPDGRHLAYTRVIKGDLAVVIEDIDAPEKKVTLLVDEARSVATSKEKDPARLRFLRWASPTRLIFAPTVRVFPPPGIPEGFSGGGPPPLAIISAPIMAVDADGKNPATLVDSKETGIALDEGWLGDPASGATPPVTRIRYRKSEIIGFLAGDRAHLLVEVIGFSEGGGRNPLVVHGTELWSIDVQTGKRKTVSTDVPDGSYAYDLQGNRRIHFMGARNVVDRVFEYRTVAKDRWGPLVKVLPGWAENKFRLTAESYFGERAYPLGFDYDPNVLFVAANIGRDTFGVYAANLTTGTQTPLDLQLTHADLVGAGDVKFPSDALVYDEFRQQLAGIRVQGARATTLWRDDELAGLQRAIEQRFPQSSVEIKEWSTDRARMMVRITSGRDPGRLYAFLSDKKELRELARSAPWLTDDLVHETEFFEFNTRGGSHISGYLTIPRRPRLAVPPLIVCFAPDFPGKPHAEFDPEAHILASMGFVVARVNQRGTAGLGRQHLDAIAGGLDKVAVTDAIATVAWVSSRHKVDPRRIATFGRGFGGYLAVRSLQLYPDVFRCAVAIDAPMGPEGWMPKVGDETAVDPSQVARRRLLEKGASDLAAISVMKEPEKITKPVLLIAQATGNEVIERIAGQNARLRSQLTSLKRVAEFIDVDEDFTLGLPKARGRVYTQMEDFFNENLYDFGVKVGPTKEIK